MQIAAFGVVSTALRPLGKNRSSLELGIDKTVSGENSELLLMFDPIYALLNEREWNEVSGTWLGDMMPHSPSNAPVVLYQVGKEKDDSKATSRANRTVEYEVGLVDKVVAQLETDPNDQDALRQLIYPAAMGHLALIDGLKNYSGDKQDIKDKLAVYSQGSTLLTVLSLVADPEFIDQNMPAGFPFNRVQVQAFCAANCFNLAKTTENPVWGYLGTYLTEDMLRRFSTENSYGTYLSLDPSKERPPRTWDQGYSLVPLARAYRLTGDQKFQDAGRAIVDTTIRDLWDSNGGGFKVTPVDERRFLSDNCSVLAGMVEWADGDSMYAGTIQGVMDKTLAFFRRDLYRGGLLRHDITAGVTSADACTGCNFWALDCMKGIARPRALPQAYLPLVANGEPTVRAAEQPKQNAYGEWARRVNITAVANPVELFTANGVKACLESLN